MSQAEPIAIWIGIDVSKTTFDAAIAAPAVHNHAAFPARSFPRTQEGAQALLAWARSSVGNVPLRAVLEATGQFSVDLAAWLEELRPAIIDPRRAHHFGKSLGVRNKTDRDDARILARYGAERLPAPYEPPTGAIATLRELTRTRQALVEQRVALEEMRTTVAFDNARKPLDTVIEAIKQQIGALDAAIEKTPSQDQKLGLAIALLDSVHGVGLLTACTIAAELGDLTRFRTGRQLTCFAGLTPRRRESGTSVRGRSPITKSGTAHVRRILYTSAMVAIRGDNHLADKYKAMVARKMNKRAALVAIARTILLEMRAILKNGKTWQAYPQAKEAKAA